jgi:hypothetical protein
LQSKFKEIKEEYLQNEEKIKQEAKPSDEIDPFHKAKEGECLKLPFIK